MHSAIKAALDAARRLRSQGPVVYQRGKCQVLLQSAAKGGQTFQIEDSSGMLSSEQSWPWLIAVDELVIDGIPIEPQRDDRIIESLSGKVCVYQLADVDGRPAWKYSDSGRSQFRVFTKLVEVQ